MGADADMQVNAFLNRLLDIHGRIGGSKGMRIHRYCIGGNNVCVEVADETIPVWEIMALEHLGKDFSGRPLLTIKLLYQDDMEAGLPQFPLELSRRAVRMAKEKPGAHEPVYYHDNETTRMSWQQSSHGYELNILQKERKLAFVVLRRRAASHRGAWIHPSPFRTIFSWWFARQESVVVHGASVGTIEDGVLLCGKGGSGKSTTALSCVEAGFLYAGDDSVLIENGTCPTIHSIYHTGGVRQGDAPKFPFLKNYKGPFHSVRSPKNIYLLAGKPGHRVVRQYPLRAILALRLSDNKESRLLPATWKSAMLALAPSTLCQFSGDARMRLNWLSGLAASVPAFILEVGTDNRKIPEKIGTVLENTSATSAQ